MSKKPAKGEYVETDTGNKVSRRSQISGTTNIILGGKSVIQAEVIIRGDLIRTSSSSADKTHNVAVSIGRYCFFSRGCELRPPGKLQKGSASFPTNPFDHLLPNAVKYRQFSHYPLKIADHVFVGPSTVVEAALIGSHVNIGANCVIGKFAIIKDYCRVLDGTVMPPNMVVPSFSIVAGRPGRVVGEIAEGEMDGMDMREVYRSVGNS